ncbi:T6SS phospholipase effector Tle1-like catalytic domain-containing protein [Chryseobacterium sp. CCH4-E10]|uniref:T6SS phospholipase effector Tle1-like catalytic domain-containing protein n=1 Tax=Chryseobacterium sp. CCH4-E10 TaxID=1768758 RepID=UPI00082A8732|nr:DUF2235 domain-containing protein [Chryseobacterium sp. CCH4-E10]
MKSNIISVGIFFDGTGNNGINATSPEKPPKNNESYYGNTTNIYKLFQLFNGEAKIYIEGIGTLTQKEDSDFAMATCKNPAGNHGYSSDDKLQKAFSFIEQISSDYNNHYELYVYGFSRGAMLARNFCYELLNENISFQKNINVKFLGVFDTIESAPFNDYNVTVHPATERAFHICAANECRFFFPLTGLFEDSGSMEDRIAGTGNKTWKKIFVPGVHADIGGGYLEGPQSVYISPNFLLEEELDSYIQNIIKMTADTEGNKLWDYILGNYKVDQGEVFCQAYISRDLVFNELSKVYGRLMLKESNAEKQIFNTEFHDSDFLINGEKHPYLIKLSDELERYMEKFSPQLKPLYNFRTLADYTHISANFGLYHPAIPKNSSKEELTEFINNGLNVPGNSNDQFTATPSKLQVEIHHIEDSVVDYAYGTNIPNNDNWNRTILIKENSYYKC